MKALTGQLRAALGAAAVGLLSLAGPAWPVTAQEFRPPGVPPPVNQAELPTPAEVNTRPYVVHNEVTQQIGPVQQTAACVQRSVNTQMDIEAEPTNQQRLRIRQAHQFATGRGQVVAVIDSGVQPHPRLVDRLLDGGDYIENHSGLFDCDGHGTAVAGLIAAAPDAGTRFVGVAPAAKIVSIRQGSASYSVRLRVLATGKEIHTIAGDTVSMARAVVHAVQSGATVINISEAACFPAEPNQVNAPDLQAAVHYAVEQNVVVVVAAANVADQCEQNDPGVVTTISSPGWFDDDVLTVAATDENGAAADFSMRGPWVDVAAPGTGAVSLDVAGAGLTTVLVSADGERSTIDGTSFATPYVAGLAALVRERFKHLTARQVMHRIEQTAQRSAGPGERSEALGYGIIDPVAALTTVLPEEQGTVPEPPPPGPLTDVALPGREDPQARTVALIGAAGAVLLLGLTGLIVYTLRWHRSR
ncbi:MAG TPA: type VII secretion-associated serine protease mycosin [Pseudonocardiaceae bacterium]|nr:type VII secretion-associated serine protease mycosin [Pseudonocardiaceae bacterium]